MRAEGEPGAEQAKPEDVMRVVPNRAERRRKAKGAARAWGRQEQNDQGIWHGVHQYESDKGHS